MKPRKAHITAKHLLLLIAAVTAVVPAAAQDTAALRFTRAVVVSHHVGDLCWNRLPDVQSYELYRRFPDQTDFTLLATLADTHYIDTLHRVICADTVSYCLLARDTAAQPIPSDTAGLFYQDNIPTAPCTLRLCTVDTLLNRVRLSWEPSPDTDVMGYYICMGSPCRDYDTVWGRLNTQYLCREDLSLDENAQAEFSFRILAFDSCYQASPLTPYYHNPVLHLSTEPCSRRLHCSWNRYINMPDSVGSYHIHYKIDGDTEGQCHTAGPNGPFAFDIDVPDLAVRQVHAYLAVFSRNDSLIAYSRVHTFRFDQSAAAEYVRITAAEYDETAPAIILDFEVDPEFQGTDCRLMRRTVKDNDNPPSPFVQIAELTRSLAPTPQQFFSYTDSDIQRTARAYVYRLDVPDLCDQRAVSSDTVRIPLPEVSDPTAYFPNTIIGGDPEVGRFCPVFVSPLADGYRLDIYNRMGERIFSTTQLSDCWDGTTRTGKALPQGAYVYQARCHHADGTTKTYTGTVLLLR